MKLTESFLDELFCLMFRDKDILTICYKNLKYEFIPKELPEYKKILKSIISQYELSGKLPSIGVVSQQYLSDISLQEVLSKIKNTKIPEDKELIITQLESYIKNVRFHLLNEQVVDLYQKGEQEEAMLLNAEESKNIISLSLRDDAGKFTRIFADFKKEQLENQFIQNEERGGKVPFFIDPLDDITNGGIDEGDTALWIMRSGEGKSTVLRWTGIKAAMLGYDVLHIQLEGSKKEATNKYTQIWTGGGFEDIRRGEIPQEIIDKAELTLKQMEQRRRDIFVYAFEKFGEASMVEVRELILEYFKIKGGYPSLIIIDSLDLLISGTNKKIDYDPSFLKYKLQKVAQLMKDVALEFKTRILTVTQTGDVPTAIWNDPDKVITRNNTEGDRTLIKPFSFVFTFNQTTDERRAKTGRIYIDKLRNYSPKEQVFPICTAYDKGAFYDAKRTLNKFYKD